MSLNDLFSAMLSRDVGQLERERKRRRPGRAKVVVPSVVVPARVARVEPEVADQDTRLQDLEQENAQLKADFAALAKILVDKGVVDRRELITKIHDARDACGKKKKSVRGALGSDSR